MFLGLEIKKSKILSSRIDKLEKIVEEQAELLRFLYNHGRDTVIIVGNLALNPTIEYVYNGQLYKIPFEDASLHSSSYAIVKNEETQTIIKIDLDKKGTKPRLYLLDKPKKTVIRIPDSLGDVINDR